MGFSLKMFFEELNALLNEDVMGRELKLQLLKELVKDAENYARECGEVI